METFTFIVVAIFLYFAADKLLDRVERSRGVRFEHRSIIFFVILFTLAAAAFALIERGTGIAGG